jgi:hypothetical protein
MYVNIRDEIKMVTTNLILNPSYALALIHHQISGIAVICRKAFNLAVMGDSRTP